MMSPPLGDGASENMKLEYSISKEQLEMMIQRVRERSLRNSLALLQRFNWPLQLAISIGLVLLMVAGLVAFVSPGTIETLIALILVLPPGLLVLRWHAKRQLRPPPAQLSETAVERSMRASTLKRQLCLVGHHHLELGDKDMKLTLPNGRNITIPWEKVSSVRHDEQFYYLTTPWLQAFGNSYYLVAKQGEGDAERHQAGLAFMLAKLQPKVRPELL